jgi:subtilisin family serine protease
VAWHDNLGNAKARHEAAIIVREFAGRNVDIGGVGTEDGGVAFMYAEGQFLAHEQYLDDIQAVLGDRARAVRVRRVIGDVVLVKIEFPAGNGGGSAESNDSASESNGGNAEGSASPPEGNGGTTEGEQPSLLQFLDEIHAVHGPRIAALDHVVTTAPGQPTGCPATEPQEVYDPKPYPPVCPGTGGEGVRIYVADTGIVRDTVNDPRFPWLQRVTGDDDPFIAADGTIMHYGGHGTFVAGVIRSMAPGAEIVVKNVFDTAGSALESDFVPKLSEGFTYGAEIFHVTVASPTMNNLPLMAFEAWLEHLRQHKGVVCVVPAGNNDERKPCWPGGFPGIISVGALSTDWRSRAYFSNYGGPVDVYAPGQNLVNAFATGTYTCEVAPFDGEVRRFSGMAQWSGTSFSTPIVTGLIAARMARTGESGQEAAAALLAEARAQAIPGVGPVLLPCCDDDDDQRRGGRCGGGGHGCCGGGGHGGGCAGHGGGECGGHGKHGPHGPRSR